MTFTIFDAFTKISDMLFIILFHFLINKKWSIKIN